MSRGFFDSFDSAKENAIDAIKPIERSRDPWDMLGGRLCHRKVLFSFSGIFREDFRSYIVNI